MSSSTTAAPVSQSERIIFIDSLRGIALLGILMMNIPYFAIPDPATDNLTLRHELGTINQQVWYFINWFLEGSQRAIFSMLFGAGIILFITRLEKRIAGPMSICWQSPETRRPPANRPGAQTTMGIRVIRSYIVHF